MVEVRAEIAASVWKLLVAPGAAVGPGEQLAILESMKMEIPVEAPAGGVVRSVEVAEGDMVQEGSLLFTLEG